MFEERLNTELNQDEQQNKLIFNDERLKQECNSNDSLLCAHFFPF